ncbi:MAG: glycosyltransferase family 2 protein [Prolixibacteraceae bacterium]|nr:glycosyltransferase family 2 protein [Prolixibacteraceae bacterium]
MPENKKVAIVILNWNGEKLFSKFLPSVTENSKGVNIEIIVADNGSTDQSIAYLQKNFPSVKIIDLKENYGFTEGYNRALKQVVADYFVLLNSDVYVTGNWLSPCLEQMESDNRLAAVQPKILSYKSPKSFEYAGAAGGFIDRFGYPFCRGRILNRLEHDDAQYDSPGSIFWASGACMFVRAEAFKKAGGFDTDFWAHMEEIDLCWRMKSLGYQIAYQPASVVYHLGGGTLSYGSPQKVFLNFRNNLWMLFKNLPKNKFKRIFFARMVLDEVAAIKFIAGFHFRSFWAVVKAHAALYHNLPQLIRKRKITQAATLVSDHKEIFQKNLMWQFFIRRKRKFSELNFNPDKQ